MAEVEFKDYSMKVKVALNDELIAWLYEAAGEIASHAKRNCQLSKKDVGIDLRAAYRYEVDEQAGEATIGNPHEAAYWEEFGTGEYALNNDGRKGWWVYVEGQHSGSGGKTYSSKEEAEKTVAHLREKGLKAHATNGRKPSRTLQKAFTETKHINMESLKKRLKDEMGK